MPAREPQPSGPSARPGWRLAWLLLLLLIPLAVALFWFNGFSEAGPGAKPISPSDPGTGVVAAPSQRLPDSKQPAVPTKINEATAPRAARIQFIDTQGMPMPGVSVSVALRVGDLWDPAAEFVADQTGRIEVPEGDGRSARLFAPEGLTFRARLSMEPRDALSNSVEVHLTQDSRFKLRRVAWLRWDVTYADGQRYGGPVMAMASPGGRALTLQLSADTDTEYEWHPDQWQSFKVSAYSRRPGYSDARGVEVRPVADAGKSAHHFVAKIVLQAGDLDLGNIEFDLTAFQADQKFRIAAKALDAGIPARSGVPQSIGEGGVIGGTRWLTRTLLPAEYHVLIVDANNGDEIRPDDEPVFGMRYETVVSVHAGETTVVTVPRAIETGSVTLRVVDSNGVPISGAVATIARGEGDNTWSWFSMKRWTPGSARLGVTPASMTDADGFTTVHGLAPLQQELFIHAVGYESARLVVTPTPLRIEQAGEVTLQPAGGVIRITIDHGEVPETDLPELQVYLLRTGGSALFPKQKLKGSTHTLTGLEDGDYTVAILAGSGWHIGRAQNVTISADSREHALTFELRRR